MFIELPIHGSDRLGLFALLNIATALPSMDDPQVTLVTMNSGELYQVSLPYTLVRGEIRNHCKG